MKNKGTREGTSPEEDTRRRESSVWIAFLHARVLPPRKRCTHSRWLLRLFLRIKQTIDDDDKNEQDKNVRINDDCLACSRLTGWLFFPLLTSYFVQWNSTRNNATTCTVFALAVPLARPATDCFFEDGIVRDVITARMYSARSRFTTTNSISRGLFIYISTHSCCYTPPAALTRQNTVHTRIHNRRIFHIRRRENNEKTTIF